MRSAFFAAALLAIAITPGCDCGTEIQPGKPCNSFSDCSGSLATCHEWRCDQGLCVDFTSSHNTLCNGAKGICTSNGTCEKCGDTKVQDGFETDVDCGGPTCGEKCDVGKKCNIAGDCKTNKCNADAGVCDEAMCTDTIKNGSESDVDCGGSCGTRCQPGRRCNQHSDCAPAGSGFCSYSGFCCAVPCNERCKKCVEGSGACTFVPWGENPDGGCADAGNACDGAGKCTGCANGSKDFSETGVDCGGGVCPRCSAADGGGCSTDEDCDSCTCDGGICAVNNCNDNIKGECESDKDCGGLCGATCGIGMNCNVKGDCLSNNCDSKTKTCIQP